MKHLHFVAFATFRTDVCLRRYKIQACLDLCFKTIVRQNGYDFQDSFLLGGWGGYCETL